MQASTTKQQYARREPSEWSRGKHAEGRVSQDFSGEQSCRYDKSTRDKTRKTKKTREAREKRVSWKDSDLNPPINEVYQSLQA